MIFLNDALHIIHNNSKESIKGEQILVLKAGVMGVEAPLTSADKKRTLRKLGKIASQVN